MKNQFICTVEDCLNNNGVIASQWCDETTTKKAEAYFRKCPGIKKYIGQMRYNITFRQNPIMIQDNFDWHQQWKAQK